MHCMTKTIRNQPDHQEKGGGGTHGHFDLLTLRTDELRSSGECLRIGLKCCMARTRHNLAHVFRRAGATDAYVGLGVAAVAEPRDSTRRRGVG